MTFTTSLIACQMREDNSVVAAALATPAAAFSDKMVLRYLEEERGALPLGSYSKRMDGPSVRVKLPEGRFWGLLVLGDAEVCRVVEVITSGWESEVV